MFKTFKKDIKDLFISPHSIEYIGFFSNLRLVFYYYFILILFFIFLSVFVGSLKYLFVNQPQIVLPIKVIFLKVAIVAPIMEEILFRLLIRVNKFNLILFFIFLLISVLYEKYILPTVAYYIFIGCFLVLLFYKNLNNKINIESNKSNFLSLLIFLSCFLFGLFHLSNFKDINTINIIVIAYLVSKTLSGFAFVLLRLKFGIIGSILLHIFINSLAYIMVS